MKKILHFFKLFHGIIRVTKGSKNMSMNTDDLLKRFYEEKENGEKYKQLYHRYYTLYKNAQKVPENRDKGTEKKIQDAVNQTTEELQNQLKEKEKEIALLRAQLKNNSSNSGIPTSRTPIGKKKKIPNTRKKTGRKKSGQKGHSRSQLANFDDDQIDEYIQRDPDVKICDRCGGGTLKLVKTLRCIMLMPIKTWTA